MERYAVASFLRGQVFNTAVSMQVALTFRWLAGHLEGDNTPTSIDAFKGTFRAVTPSLDDKHFNEVIATLAKDNDIAEGITYAQLVDYFFESISGRYHTGQGSKSSKSRAEDVHATFLTHLIGKTMEQGLRVAVGQQLGSDEEILEHVFVNKFSQNFEVTPVNAADLFGALDYDRSGAIDSDELRDYAFQYATKRNIK